MSITRKITNLARGPRGQRIVEQVERRVQEYAARPETQRRLAQLRERLARQPRGH